MEKILYLIIVFFIPAHLPAQDFKNDFSFDGQRKGSKIWEIKAGKGFLTVDNAGYSGIGKSWCLTGYYNNFQTFIYSYFNLPAEAKKIEASVYARTELLKDAWLKLWYLDVDENILKKDSVLITNAGSWEKFSLSNFVPGTQRLYIEIAAKADPLIPNNPKKKQKLFIDNMKISIDGNELTSLSPEIPLAFPEDTTPICPGETDSLIQKSFPNISGFKTAQIIALGETIHGCGDIEHCFFETTKYLIRNENCRLVLFEIGFELGLWLNEYVNGEVPKEEIIKWMALYNFDLKGLMDLLNWIKEYNLDNRAKVRCLGMDMNIGLLNICGFDHLGDWLKAQHLDQDSIQPFFVLCKKRDYSGAEQYVLKASCFKKLEKSKRSCLLRALVSKQEQQNFNPLLTYDENSSLLEGGRDLIMYHNARFAIDNFVEGNEKAVIYAHLGHLNKKNAFGGRLYIPSVGSYLAQHYNSRYFVVALLAAEGTYSNTDSVGDFSSTLQLVPPVSGSIESSFMNSHLPFIYRETEDFQETINCRNIGLSYTKEQFYPCSSKNRFDAVMFLKHVSGYPLFPGLPRTREDRKLFIDEQRVKNGHKKFFDNHKKQDPDMYQLENSCKKPASS